MSLGLNVRKMRLIRTPDLERFRPDGSKLQQGAMGTVVLLS